MSRAGLIQKGAHTCDHAVYIVDVNWNDCHRWLLQLVAIPRKGQPQAAASGDSPALLMQVRGMSRAER